MKIPASCRPGFETPEKCFFKKFWVFLDNSDLDFLKKKKKKAFKFLPL